MAALRVRFAPSPTGALHLGSALTAVANYALARAHAGALVLRIDDTDLERSDAALARQVLDTLEWLGLDWDEGPRAQATLERAARYADVLAGLIESGRAYHCFCSEQRLASLAAAQQEAGLPPRYDGHCRELTAHEVADRLAAGERSVVRLRVEDARDWGFDDLVRGRVAAPPGSFGDYILQRGDGTAGYMFASVVDDVDYDVTHVVRGSDHLANTPRQLALFDALDAPPPAFAHLPLLTGPHGRKLSKRDPLGSVDQLRDAGFLPRSLRRYLMELLGQGAVDPVPGTGDSDAPTFDLGRVPSSSPQVSLDRLASIAREDLAAVPVEALLGWLAARGVQLSGTAAPLLDDLRGEHESLDALARALRGVAERPTAAPPAGAHAALDELLRILGENELRDMDAASAAVAALRAWAKQHGRPVPEVLQPARIALTGVPHGPRLDAVLHAVGRDEARERVGAALARIAAAQDA